MRTILAFFLLVLISPVPLCSGAEFDVNDFPVRYAEEGRFREAMALGESDSAAALSILDELRGSSRLPADAVAWATGLFSPDDGAVKSLEAIVDIGRSSPFYVDALDRLARIAEDKSDWKQAANHLSQAVKRLDEDKKLAPVLARLLNAYDKLGEDKKALKTAIRLWIRLPHMGESEVGEAYLARHNGDPMNPVSGEDIFIRGRTLLDKGDRTEAIETLLDLRPRLLPGTRFTPELDLALGKAFYFLRRYEEAVPPLGRAIEHSKKAATRQAAGFYRARSLFGLSMGHVGAAELFKMAKEWPDASNAPMWLYQSYRVFEGRGMAGEAGASKGRLVKFYPSSDYALDVGWWEGWELFEHSRYGEAARAFSSSVSRAPRGWQHARGIYWAGRSYAKGGETAKGDELYGKLLSLYPLGYYARFVKNEMAGRLPSAGLGDPRGMGATVLATPLPTERDIHLDGPLGPATSYLRLGLVEAARVKLENGAGSRPVELWLRYWAEDFKETVRKAGCRWDQWPWPGGPDGRDDACRLSFPLAYPRSVALAAKAADIHPHLLLAIARTESHFNPDGFSSWEARGLMQFIPNTATAIAGELGLEEFEQQDLFDPPTALAMGARYLRKLLDRFDGNVVAAVAAYNGGGKQVQKWLDKNKGVELPEFVEKIPFRETKRYVKKVLTALDAYGRLDSQGLWVQNPPDLIDSK